MQSEAAGLPDYAMQFRIRRVGIARYTPPLVYRDFSVPANYANLSNAGVANTPREFPRGTMTFPSKNARSRSHLRSKQWLRITSAQVEARGEFQVRDEARQNDGLRTNETDL
ncbi:hypothetical protein PUN28_003851 [Cardiocondyla obscurior]|uniref:Uncharacterized protein n=1 Tax=Cardiocondyla obscurior TaxID=286306 RepID=A0AAW2GPB5_9HYME